MEANIKKAERNVSFKRQTKERRRVFENCQWSDVKKKKS